MWVKRELHYALTERRYANRIIPLLFKPCDYTALSWVLPQLQVIDFTGEYQSACRKLLAIWKIRLHPGL
jgi:hypothetical protein